jgi:hypothetical protein
MEEVFLSIGVGGILKSDDLLRLELPEEPGLEVCGR